MKMLLKGLFIAFLTAAFDQWSKFYVFNLFTETGRNVIEILPFFNLSKVYNYGVSFGMFSHIAYGRLILSFIALAIVIMLCFWLFRTTKFYMAIAMGMVIGGAVGNVIDRFRFGAVADFLDFHVGGYHWPAFNIADSAVFIGVFILFIDSFLSKEDKGEEK